VSDKPFLTDTDHYNFDNIVRNVLEAHQRGEISIENIVGGLGHILGAVDNRSRTEVDNWTGENGISLFKDYKEDQ
jgi:hypothetical protein